MTTSDWTTLEGSGHGPQADFWTGNAGNFRLRRHSTKTQSRNQKGAMLCADDTQKSAAVAARVRECSAIIDAFPEFTKHPANRIARSDEATPRVEGYVFDGADGSQMAFWISETMSWGMFGVAHSLKLVSTMVLREYCRCYDAVRNKL
jgi:hypothetical protein